MTSFNDCIFEELCKVGNLSDISNEMENITTFTNFINSVKCLCIYGYFSQAKLLFQTGIEKNFIKINDKNKIIINNISNNKLEVVFLENILINNLHFAFTGACYNGHFEVVKWLVFELNIDISINAECSFILACCNGHLQIAKFLLEIKPDLNNSIYNELPFRLSCANNKIEVAKWLSNICHNRYVILNCDEYEIKYEIIEIDECPICLEPCCDIMSKCKHKYCSACIARCVQYNIYKCAICRRNLKDTVFIKIIK